MENDLDLKKYNVLQQMANVEVCQNTEEFKLTMDRATKIPFAEIATLGAAFQPVASMAQFALHGSGESGLYYVNTMGKQMFMKKGTKEFIGSLQDSAGTVGGGQARLTQLPFDPTMLAVTAAMVAVEHKLDAIQKTQEQIVKFLEQQEISKIEGNFVTLNDVISNYKFNIDNLTYKQDKHILVQTIKCDTEKSLNLIKKQIAEKLKNHSKLHSDIEVKKVILEIQNQFKNYQLALYTYSFSAFLEILLLENFDEAYLDNIVRIIEDHAYDYRKMYTECYDLINSYSESSVETAFIKGLSSVTKAVGNVVAKTPKISDTQLDENLILASEKLKDKNIKKNMETMSELVKMNDNVVLPFVTNIKLINKLYNKPIKYLFDKDNIYYLTDYEFNS